MNKENNSKHDHQEKDAETVFRCRFCAEEFSLLSDLKAHKSLLHPALAGALTDLEKIKAEIIKEIKPGKPAKGIAWNSAIVSAILVLLMIFSAIQTVQSFTIWQKIEKGTIKPASAQSTGDTPLPANLNNLPNMVGGC